MKLAEKSPIRDTTRTNPSGLFRNGKIVNPTPCARREISRILFPLPVLSRMPPHMGESPIVSIAGMRDDCLCYFKIEECRGGVLSGGFFSRTNQEDLLIY